MMNQNNSGFLNSIPVVTKNLIIINVLFWIASITLPKVNVDLVALLGLHFPGAKNFNPIQFISYMFMHDTRSISHLFFNMFAVYMFGRILEQVWGPKRFLIFYMVTGVGAGLIQELSWFFELRDVLFSGHDMVNLNGVQLMAKSEFLNLFVTVGASGAVFGILLAFGMKFPDVPLYIMFVPIPIKAKYFVVGYGLIELFLGVSNFSGDNVAHFAHLGGMLFGYFLIRYWKKKDAENGRYF
ncbi:membrane associated rhomboid family serine protease [Parabacteroides sp. PF5-5]|uniref:rhomboid family intramembrane serine protease n=1 Tax=unclassified Parabacteroides TaxID=2649774 RepID=UPI002475A2AE|nr:MULTISPECIES: rhomboid family intramembrane serine protease [unclassified Parabacteroides]MDH6304967.1 membrane associated rhomboid family serine protease [Parabacteroides sp. PH5-39]MDH6315947.1 membrane associated rhomboid family serine protease [Parabacteroides sp. PF5-13]MDH6319604.1 membrane associated rhomboid family serine protease [Parabacteroides sp. PH5-13]MDH6323335.1 membrane associated rhomboid family serine protease [Parabacteroides sp. PH5-8]MDH6327156.1 membrane associated r